MGLEDFIKFYKKNLNLCDNDFDNLLETLQKPLMSAFRITNTVVKEFILKKLSNLNESKVFPNVYEVNKRKMPFRNFIVTQTSVGNIQRQEVVSMLPVFLMNLKKCHSVLDMCAAPGSKTKQLLEIVGDDGLVVANEVKSKRLEILVSECCKLPSKSLLVIKHDASKMPIFKNDFDRVLCDVPCSGDATARKNLEVLPKWNLQNALSLIELQFKILKHSLNFVKDDGLIIYSTCSLNIMENECIIQKAVLEENLEIVDLRENINEEYISKDFKIRNGITNWHFDLKKYNNINLEPIDKDIGLSKCLRVYPHDQNTGGFFIVGLKKISKKTKQLKSFKPRFNIYEIDEELKKILQKNYKLENNIYIQRWKNAKSIYEVNDEILKILKTSPLNVAYFGKKVFVKSTDIELNWIRKVSFNKENLLHDIELDEEKSKNFINKKEILFRFKKGPIIVLCNNLKIKIGALSDGEKIVALLDDKLQKALKQLLF